MRIKSCDKHKREIRASSMGINTNNSGKPYSVYVNKPFKVINFI